MKKWLPQILGLAFSCFLGLAVLELGVRLIEPKRVLRSDFEKPDSLLHHRFVPGALGAYKTLEFHNSYSINSLGMRDREVSRAKPPGTGRVLMLGDSFTEGIGVEAAETFSARVQTMVDEAGLARRWEVLNGGVASYSPLLEYLYLKNGGLDVQPDLVVLNLDLSDVWDDIHYTKLAVKDAAGQPVAVPAEPERLPGPWYVDAAYSLKDFLKEHTRLWNFARRSIAPFVMAKPVASGDVREDKYAMLRKVAPPEDDRDWSLTFGYLLQIRDLLAARGIPLWIAVYPYGLQVSTREWDIGRRYWGFEPGKTYTTAPIEQVKAFGAREGIPVVDMTPEFMARAGREFPLYFNGDGHWLPAGHAVAAAVHFRHLLPFLQQASAAPPGPSESAELQRARPLTRSGSTLQRETSRSRF